MTINILDLDMLSQQIHAHHRIINLTILEQQIDDQKKYEAILTKLLSTSFDFLLGKHKTYITEINFSIEVYLILKNEEIKYFSTITPNIFKLLLLDYKYIPFEITFHSKLENVNTSFSVKKDRVNIFNLIFRPRLKIKNEALIFLNQSQMEEVFKMLMTLSNSDHN